MIFSLYFVFFLWCRFLASPSQPTEEHSTVDGCVVVECQRAASTTRFVKTHTHTQPGSWSRQQPALGPIALPPLCRRLARLRCHHSVVARDHWATSHGHRQVRPRSCTARWGRQAQAPPGPSPSMLYSIAYGASSAQHRPAKRKMWRKSIPGRAVRAKMETMSEHWRAGGRTPMGHLFFFFGLAVRLTAWAWEEDAEEGPSVGTVRISRGKLTKQSSLPAHCAAAQVKRSGSAPSERK